MLKTIAGCLLAVCCQIATGDGLYMTQEGPVVDFGNGIYWTPQGAAVDFGNGVHVLPHETVVDMGGLMEWRNGYGAAIGKHTVETNKGPVMDLGGGITMTPHGVVYDVYHQDHPAHSRVPPPEAWIGR